MNLVCLCQEGLIIDAGGRAQKLQNHGLCIPDSRNRDRNMPELSNDQAVSKQNKGLTLRVKN